MKRHLMKLGTTAEDMDALVSDVALEVASNVNNAGLKAQLEFLALNGVSDNRIYRDLFLSYSDNGAGSIVDVVGKNGEASFRGVVASVEDDYLNVVNQAGITISVDFEQVDSICEPEIEFVNQCKKCSAKLDIRCSVIREYTNKSGGESVYAEGHYESSGDFEADSFNGFKSGSSDYDLLDDSDSCSSCDNAL